MRAIERRYIDVSYNVRERKCDHISHINFETKPSTALGLSRQNSDEVSNVLFMTAPAAPLLIMSY